jgi:RNA polymerase sigma-70 factor (ECF subfamily)
MDHLTTLLLAAQAGDRTALERFVVESQHDVAAVCRYLGDADNTDDLVQETYARAFSALHRFRATGPAKHWLLTIARRTCVDAIRRRSRLRRLGATLQHEHEHELRFHPGVEQRFELDSALLALDLDRRAAFVLTQINGLRYEEAAQLLGVPIGTIRSRVARAREQLAAVMAGGAAAGDGGEPPAAQHRPLSG